MALWLPWGRALARHFDAEHGRAGGAVADSKVVPPDHLVRQIDDVLDLGWVHKELAPYYLHTGRASIDPVLMIWMLMVDYVFAIRSERTGCVEVQVNFARVKRTKRRSRSTRQRPKS
jgi:hypothetical protein